LLAKHYENNWFYRLIEQRWGMRAAVIMTKSRQARLTREMRQRQMQNIAHGHTPSAAGQSRSIGV